MTIRIRQETFQRWECSSCGTGRGGYRTREDAVADAQAHERSEEHRRASRERRITRAGVREWP